MHLGVKRNCKICCYLIFYKRYINWIISIYIHKKYFKSFNSKNIETISIRINILFWMVIVSLGNIGFQLLNNLF